MPTSPPERDRRPPGLTSAVLVDVVLPVVVGLTILGFLILVFAASSPGHAG